MFSLDHFTFVSRSERSIYYVQKSDHWDYSTVEAYLLSCTEFVRLNPEYVLLIFCQHPHAYTVGKGLQRLSSESQFNLVDFDPTCELDYPLYQLKRGGGLTFHYPGQMVFYPILSLTHQKLNVHDFMLEILELTKKILENKFAFKNLHVNKELLGLWHDHQSKLASIGLAITRFVTYHGLALNFLNDDEMFQSIKSVHPCGLPGNVYTSVEKLSSCHLTSDDLDEFIKLFQKEFLHLIMDKQISSSSINFEISL